MVQVHRSGAITAYRTARILIDNRRLISATTIGRFFVDAAHKLITFARESGLAGSAVLNTGLVQLDGFQFAVADPDGFNSVVDSKRDEILLPEAWIDDLSDDSLVADELLRPAFDVLWQSHGFSECPHFDAAGKWSPPR
jgi:hypothetical protein